MPETDLLKNTDVERTFQHFQLLNMVLRYSGEVSSGSQETQAAPRLPLHQLCGLGRCNACLLSDLCTGDEEEAEWRALPAVTARGINGSIFSVSFWYLLYLTWIVTFGSIHMK